MSTTERSKELVAPGQITDAADSRDMLDALIEANTQIVEDRSTDYVRVQMAKARERDVRANYESRAREYFRTLARRCRSHRWVRLPSNSLDVCEHCGVPNPAQKKTSDAGYPYETENMTYTFYLRDQARGLARELIALDAEAGVLEDWPPEADHFIGMEHEFDPKREVFLAETKGPRRLFRRRR